MGTPQHTNPRDSLHKEIAKLRRALEEREAEISVLKEATSHRNLALLVPASWRITSTEARMVAALVSSGNLIMTKDQLMQNLYGDRQEEPESKIIDVFVCKLRKKLSMVEELDGQEVLIETVWGRGYRFPPAVRAIVIKAMQQNASGPDEFADTLSHLRDAAHQRVSRRLKAAAAEMQVLRELIDDAKIDVTTFKGRMEAGAAITRWHFGLGMTHEKFAEHVGVSVPLLYQMKRGMASGEHYTRAAKFLKDYVEGESVKRNNRAAAGGGR